MFEVDMKSKALFGADVKEAQVPPPLVVFTSSELLFSPKSRAGDLAPKSDQCIFCESPFSSHKSPARHSFVLIDLHYYSSVIELKATTVFSKIRLAMVKDMAAIVAVAAQSRGIGYKGDLVGVGQLIYIYVLDGCFMKEGIERFLGITSFLLSL